jgi:hypothetical protein
MISHIIAAALLVAQAAPNPSAAPPCLSREEVGDLVITLAPAMLGAVAERCHSHVGPAAFLNTGWEPFRLRLESEATRHRAAALHAFVKMAGGEALSPDQEGAAMTMMTASLTAGVGTGLPLEACSDADRIIGALAPLPPENLGVLAGAIMALVSTNQGHHNVARGRAGGAARAEHDFPAVCPA